jgi:tight adherence protein C
VVQADQKGSPLAEVLASQAVTSRNRRSVATEEAAARAGVLMIVPLMLLMGCIVLLLVGPLIVTGASP